MTKRSWKDKLSLLKHLSMEKSYVFQNLDTYNLAYSRRFVESRDKSNYLELVVTTQLPFVWSLTLSFMSCVPVAGFITTRICPCFLRYFTSYLLIGETEKE